MGGESIKRILFLTQVLPFPLDAGPKVRAYYVLSWLAERYAVTLLSFVRESDTRAAVEHLKGLCEQVVTVPLRRSPWRDGLAFLRSLVSGKPFLITRDQSQQMEAARDRLLDAGCYDYVHADQLWMASYAYHLNKKASRPKTLDVKTILDQHNAVHLIPKRLAEGTRNPLMRQLLKREARLMARYEVETCAKFDHVVWVTQDDWDAVQEVTRKKTHHPPSNLQPPAPNLQSPAPHLQHPTSSLQSPTSIIPICIDPDNCQPVIPLTAAPTVLFLGGMHWPPNAEGVRWFVREVWPLVRASVPEAHFHVVGKSPPEELRGLHGVSAPGYIIDIAPYWRLSRIFVVPLRAGGGMRVKILDAWSRGLPVVSTTIGAEGIAYQNGDNILIADSPDDMARAVRMVLTEPGLAERLGENGRLWVEANYHWRIEYQNWAAVYTLVKETR